MKSILKSLGILIRIKITSLYLPLYAAKWIRRLAHFLDRTEPGPFFVFVFASMVGFLLGFLPHGGNAPMLSMWECVKGGFLICLKFGFTALILLYVFWEISRGMKALHRWAERYQNKVKESKKKEQEWYAHNLEKI